MFVDSALARRLERAQAWRGVYYVRAQAKLRPETMSMAEAVAGGHMLFGGVTSPLNRAVGLGLQGPVSSADLECVAEFYHSRGTVPRIDLCPLADRSLLDQLKQRGYRLERFYSVLARVLDDDVLAFSPPPHIRITRVGPEQADLWILTTAQGFTGKEPPPMDAIEILTPNYYCETAVCFMAWIEGQPAGGGGMYTHEGVVELGGASTRLAFRKRGVQAALLQARLAAARQAGCDLAVVETAPGTDSQHNVERAGFTVAYTKAVMVGD